MDSSTRRQNIWAVSSTSVREQTNIAVDAVIGINKQAKGQVKILNKSEKPKAKTPRERTQKAQPEKEFLITLLAKALEVEDISNLNIENKAKLITFDYKGASYKLDLVQKRPPKAKTE